jgi:hypothetical protein
MSAWSFCVARATSLPALLLCACIWGYAGAEELKPDEDTLFLAHYNTSINADYSQGSPECDIVDAAFLTGGGGGYFGEGLACRVGDEALRDVGADPDEANVLFLKTAFDGVRYPANANLDLERGTFECWYKPYFSAERAPDMPANWPLQYPIFAFTETAGSVLVLGINHYTASKSMYFHVARKGDRIGFDRALDWEPRTWHHIAITWDTKRPPGEIALFLDGKCVGRRDTRPLKKGFLRQTGEFPYFCIGSNLWRRSGNTSQFQRADGIIDEVRISNIVRYKEDFTPERR